MPVLIYPFVQLVVLAETNRCQKQCQCSHHLPESLAVTTVSSVEISRPFSCLSWLGGLRLYEHRVVAALSGCGATAVPGV